MADAGRRALLVAGVAGVTGAAAAWAGVAAVKRTLELPGLVDLQVNGFAGVDFTDPALDAERLRTAVAAIETTGVTRFLPTLITSPLETFAGCARTIAR